MKLPALSVLLVDHDANFRRTLAVALRLDGHLVGEAACAEEARRALDATGFEAVLINLLRPDGDDIELARRIGVEWPDSIPIVCSPHPELLAAARLLMPAALQLHKPFPSHSLTALLRAARSPATLQPV